MAPSDKAWQCLPAAVLCQVEADLLHPDMRRLVPAMRTRRGLRHLMDATVDPCLAHGGWRLLWSTNRSVAIPHPAARQIWASDRRWFREQVTI